ncbi:hypothetical protein HZB60_10480 [candidate division KSB1 bacterium]|nr:hypothetical protein [candidate division KSB1 bacterium]
MKRHSGTRAIWWELLVPGVLWSAYFAGILFAANPVYRTMRQLAELSLPIILVLGAALLVLPALAAVTAFLKFNQSRRYSHSREGNMRLFGAGIAGAVFVVWGILLFSVPGR